VINVADPPIASTMFASRVAVRQTLGVLPGGFAFQCVCSTQFLFLPILNKFINGGRHSSIIKRIDDILIVL
jgi:hypothetical protein